MERPAHTYISSLAYSDGFRGTSPPLVAMRMHDPTTSAARGLPPEPTVGREGKARRVL